MIKNIGIEIPQEISDIVKSEKCLALIATFSEKTLLHMTPISTICQKNKESFLIAMLSDNIGYKNLVWQKKVLVSFLESPEITIHIVGRAGIVRAPSKTHPLIHIAQIDIIDIIKEDSMLVHIDTGLKWKHISNEMKNLHEMIMKELYECAKVL